MLVSTIPDDSMLHASGLLCNTWYGDFYEGDLFLLRADGTGEVCGTYHLIVI